MKRTLALIALSSILALSVFAFTACSSDDATDTITFSVEDFGVRETGYSGAHAEQLGYILSPTAIKVEAGDTLASITVRALTEKGMTAVYTGTTGKDGGFYMTGIYGFKDKSGADIAEANAFGGGTVGAMSGWMITINNWFADVGAGDIAVEAGDHVRVRYSCSFGADIGNDYMVPSATITGIKTDSKYGTVAKTADKEYTLTLAKRTSKVKIEAELENYGAKVTYKVGDTEYKFLRDIPVEDGTEITVSSSFTEYGATSPVTDSVVVKVVKP